MAENNQSQKQAAVFNLVGRYAESADKRGITGYSIQDTASGATRRVTLQQLSFLIGRDRIANCKAQIYHNDILIRGIGISIASLPLIGEDGANIDRKAAVAKETAVKEQQEAQVEKQAELQGKASGTQILNHVKASLYAAILKQDTLVVAEDSTKGKTTKLRLAHKDDPKKVVQINLFRRTTMATAYVVIPSEENNLGHFEYHDDSEQTLSAGEAQIMPILAQVAERFTAEIQEAKRSAEVRKQAEAEMTVTFGQNVVGRVRKFLKQGTDFKEEQFTNREGDDVEKPGTVLKSTMTQAGKAPVPMTAFVLQYGNMIDVVVECGVAGEAPWCQREFRYRSKGYRLQDITDDLTSTLTAFNDKIVGNSTTENKTDTMEVSTLDSKEEQRLFAKKTNAVRNALRNAVADRDPNATAEFESENGNIDKWKLSYRCGLDNGGSALLVMLATTERDGANLALTSIRYTVIDTDKGRKSHDEVSRSIEYIAKDTGTLLDEITANKAKVAELVKEVELNALSKINANNNVSDDELFEFKKNNVKYILQEVEAFSGLLVYPYNQLGDNYYWGLVYNYSSEITMDMKVNMVKSGPNLTITSIDCKATSPSGEYIVSNDCQIEYNGDADELIGESNLNRPKILGLVKEVESLALNKAYPDGVPTQKDDAESFGDDFAFDEMFGEGAAQNDLSLRLATEEDRKAFTKDVLERIINWSLIALPFVKHKTPITEFQVNEHTLITESSVNCLALLNSFAVRITYTMETEIQMQNGKVTYICVRGVHINPSKIDFTTKKPSLSSPFWLTNEACEMITNDVRNVDNSLASCIDKVAVEAAKGISHAICGFASKEIQELIEGNQQGGSPLAVKFLELLAKQNAEEDKYISEFGKSRSINSCTCEVSHTINKQTISFYIVLLDVDCKVNTSYSVIVAVHDNDGVEIEISKRGGLLVSKTFEIPQVDAEINSTNGKTKEDLVAEAVMRYIYLYIDPEKTNRR